MMSVDSALLSGKLTLTSALLFNTVFLMYFPARVQEPCD